MRWLGSIWIIPRLASVDILPRLKSWDSLARGRPSDPSESLLLVRANHVGAFTRAWRPRTTPFRRRSPRLWHTGRAIDPTAIEATSAVPDRAGLLFFVDGVHQFNPTFPVRVGLINDSSGPKSCGFGGCGGTQRGLSLGPTAEAAGFRLHSVRTMVFEREALKKFSYHSQSVDERH